MSQGELDVEGAGGVTLRGALEEGGGDGVSIVLAHGLTAHRDLVVHGSRALARAGHDVVRYDARAHGTSEPGASGSREYGNLSADLAAVVEQGLGPEVRPVLAGQSMGAHTLVALALESPERYAGLVIIGPATVGTPPTEDSLERWDALAEGLDDDGIDGFLAVYAEGLDPDWSETLVRIARDRLSRHRDLAALSEALREVPRSLPFDGLGELEGLDLPVLVVASHDAADPGHPYAVAEAYAEALPSARLISEEEGKSPLAWQGGKLSREIAAFCAEDEVRERAAA